MIDRCSSTILIASCIALALVSLSCDEAQIRSSTSTQPLVFQESGLRFLVTPSGLETLYGRARPEGFIVSAERREVWREEGIVIEAGPIEQVLTPSEFVTTPTDGAVETTTEFDSLELLVALRVRRGADVRICRKGVSTDSASVNAAAELVEGDSGPTFAVTRTPVLADDDWAIRDIGACSQGELPIAFDLESALVTYARDAMVLSTVEALETSPLDTLGVVLDRIEVRRISAFEPNRGTALLEGRLPEDGAEVTPMGLTARLDTALDVERAGCAPPVDLPPSQFLSAAPIDPSALSGTDADVAFAIGGNVLNRSAHVTALGGFACRGFEDVSADDGNGELIPTDELLLEELGLEDLPLGERSRVVFRPGSLPELTLRPERGDLLLDWDEVTIDIYSELFGVPTRIATLETSVQATLRPRAGEPGFVGFAVETIDVLEVSLDSDLAVEPEAQVVESWTRRTLLIALEDLFNFPLPVRPDSQIEVVRTEVRSDDLLVIGRF